MSIFDVETADDFERDVLRAGDPTVVMFWASWCPFCREFLPTFADYASRLEGRFARVSLDDEDNPLWDTFDVRVVPSLAFFRDGALAARRDGELGRGLSEGELESFLRGVLPATT